jgi:molecular chaperone GrpE (heat shock protein)
MTDPTLDPTTALLTARLDELVREVRRQGRAAVAAQAAAESCLEKITAHALRAATEDEVEDDDVDLDADVAWIEAMLPLSDALDRVVSQASAMAERRARPAKRRFWQLRPAAEPDPELRTLVDGLRVLRAQLAAALEGLGVTADRRVGVAVDPGIHRVIEVRAPRGAEREGMVVEVIRPGYSAGTRLIREAEVVATGDRDGYGEG